jgi:fatty acid desaturase
MMQHILTLGFAIPDIVPLRCAQVQRSGRHLPLAPYARYTAGVDEVVYAHRGVDRARLTDLNRRSDTRGLLHLAGHGALLLATGTLLALSIGSWWVAPATVLHGVVLIALFAPLHETIHRTAFKSRWLNDAVGWLCGFLLVLPPEYFRFFHFAHHRHTQDPLNDPELASPKPTTFTQWLIHASGWGYWRAELVGLVTHALGRTPEPFLNAPRAAARVATEARIVLIVYALIAAIAVATGSWAPLTYWVLPALTGQPFLRFYLLAEHTLCPLVPDMLANSRTTRTNGIVRFLAWNMPYHAEHHAFPSVPFHALPSLHGDLRPDLKVVAAGYVTVNREIIRRLQ